MYLVITQFSLAACCILETRDILNMEPMREMAAPGAGFGFNPSFWALVSAVDKLFWFCPDQLAWINQATDCGLMEQVRSCFLPCREPDGQLIAPITEGDLAESPVQISILWWAAKLGLRALRKWCLRGHLVVSGALVVSLQLGYFQILKWFLAVGFYCVWVFFLLFYLFVVVV